MSVRDRLGRERVRALASGDWFRPRPLSEWTLLGTFGVVLACSVVIILGGVVGVVAAVVFVVAWLVLPAIQRYAVGHALALATTPEPFSVVELFFLEFGLVAVLFGPLTRSEHRNRRAVAASMLWFGVTLFTLLIITLTFFEELWTATIVLLAVVVVLGYSLRRIGLGTLGLLDTSSSDGREAADENSGGTGR